MDWVGSEKRGQDAVSRRRIAELPSFMRAAKPPETTEGRRFDRGVTDLRSIIVRRPRGDTGGAERDRTASNREPASLAERW